MVQSPKPIKQNYGKEIYVVPSVPGPISTNPIAGAKIISIYFEQNQTDIDQIVAECNDWVNGLDASQVRELGLRVDKKPYIKLYMALMPKFTKK